MSKMILQEKAGFQSSMPFNIYEPDGKLFYSSDFTDHIEKGERLDFNLPAGEYTFDGSFIKLPYPVKTSFITLPQKERNFTKKRYDIEYGTNPNKCTIYYERGLILFDNSIMSKPLYVKYGIYYHELGHHFYETEWKADLYSAKMMLDKGFNPSQVGRVVTEGLSEKSMDRILRLVSELTKNVG